MRKLIEINEYSTTPKYLQISSSILSRVEDGDISIGDKLPSVNRLLIDFDISRDTIVKAYHHLQKIGVVESVKGKGYFVKSTETKRKAKVFLLFNKLSHHKKIIYDSLSETLGEAASIDFFIYHNDFRLFKNYITSNLGNNYTHFVIIAHFIEGGSEAHQVINEIPTDKLILLDKKVPNVHGDFGAVYQEFQKNIYSALTEVQQQLSRYKTLKIIFPKDGYHPHEILTGFKNFCTEYGFEYSIVNEVLISDINKGDVFINLMEADLVSLIKEIKRKNLVVGHDIGIISYNETPLKEVLLDGITVISTDFHQLGQSVGKMILEKRREQIENPFRIILRNSL